MGARRAGLVAVTVTVLVLVTGCTPTSSNLPATGIPSSSATGDATIVRGLEAPWSLAMLPDGGALVSQRDDGRILEISAVDHAVREVGTVPGVVAQSEAGLNGIAVWKGDGGTWLYAYHASADDNRVVRMPLLGPSGSYRLGDAQVVLRGIRKASFHNGGRLAFGPDGMLYVTTGDAGQSSDAQDTSSLNGKILRITPEGAPAPGNPFGNAVYSYGHRNVQGIAWTGDGVMWADEFGQDTWDELNVIVPGGDYGWPVVEGIAHDDRYRDPLLQWHTDEASPSGLTAVGDVLYLACLRGERLWRVKTDGDSVVGEPVALLQGNGRLRDAALAEDGTLWVLTNNTDGRGSPREGDDRVLRFAVT